ncbi:hypothetical protein ACOME3_002406 [Neoechinorhynchus agilis]
MRKDARLIDDFANIVSYLIDKENIKVYIEEPESKYLLRKISSDDERWKNVVKIDKVAFKEEQSQCSTIDFIVVIGGDGTLIRATSFFPRICPPVLPFNSGSIGFLNPFSIKHYQAVIKKLMRGDAPVLARCRLSLKVFSNNRESPVRDYVAMNEIVIDRGAYAFLTNIDMHINDRFITKVQGDGLIVSTPTGSTAYAMAAGASMVHPSVDAMVVCPICPHSLSFRPIIVPQRIVLRLTVPDTARNAAWLSVDGNNVGEVSPGQIVEITNADYPVPCICDSDQISDWFESLAHCLHWNVRNEQKPIVDGEDDALE